MTDEERREHARLLRLWATGKATRRQMLRCTELDRRAVLLVEPSGYAARVESLEAEGLTRSDAQGVADVEFSQADERDRQAWADIVSGKNRRAMLAYCKAMRSLP